LNLKNRWVHFRIRDVYIPSPQELLDGLYGDQILQGRVVDFSDSGSPEEVFVVLEVEGRQQPVVVPVKNILGVV
jgi:hypothetical protein